MATVTKTIAQKPTVTGVRHHTVDKPAEIIAPTTRESHIQGVYLKRPIILGLHHA